MGLLPAYLPIYDALCAHLSPDWQPYYGIRTLEEQAALYARGRDFPGAEVTDAKPGDSPHNYGCATDWIIFSPKGIPAWLHADDARWKEYAAACDEAGAKWGGDFKGRGQRLTDKGHNELRLRIKWSEVGNTFRQRGLLEAERFIVSWIA